MRYSTPVELVDRVGAFLGTERLSLGPWQSIERNLQRLLIHQGAEFADRVGQSGDGGADVIGFLRGELWVIQSKFRGSGQLVDRTGVEEVVRAAVRYEASRAVVACTSGFTPDAIEAAQAATATLGRPVQLWDRDYLESLAARLPSEPAGGNEPRPYQDEAISAFTEAISAGSRRGLLLMATGLGKTRVAAGVIRRWLEDRPGDEVLVLAPGLELVDQLEASLWPYLPSHVATHVLNGDEKPTFSGGVVVSTLQSMRNVAADNSRRFGLIVVDEAHHAPSPRNREALEILAPRFLMGMTATPWRSDTEDPATIFGEPLYTASIVEGIKGGYLAEVDYEMLVDDIDWDWLSRQLKDEQNLTVRDLNRFLFVPERDDEIVRRIKSELDAVPDYRGLIYTRSIDHAERFSAKLAADGIPASALHSGLDKFDRANRLNRFRRRGRGVLVTVDMLNEGIDVPQVNVVVFLRVTHSRTVFLQQLGRGLRVARGKTRVRVLDFVSDIRRIAAGLELNDGPVDEWGKVRPEPKDAVVMSAGRIVQFSSEKSLDFVRGYLADVADLQDRADSAVLKFPDPLRQRTT